jgi:hypothetical protein
MPDLTFHRLENLPTRLVAVEQPLGEVLFEQRDPQRLEQGQALFKSARQRSRGNGCAQAVQIRA